MIIDGLLKAEPHLKIAERVLDPKKYLHLTDDIMPFIEASEDPVSLASNISSNTLANSVFSPCLAIS